MKTLPRILVSALLLSTASSTAACAFIAGPGGPRAGQSPAQAAAPGSEAPSDAPVGPSDDGAADSGDAPTATVSASASTAEVPPLDTAALCTKASSCTTSVSMELCGLLNPKCLDAFHKHLDGADRASCQAKFDRLPQLAAEWGPPGYKLPEQCR